MAFGQNPLRPSAFNFKGLINQNLIDNPSSVGVDAVDYTHASKTFRRGGYDLAPRNKFLFHVYFNLNTNIPAVANLTSGGKGSTIGLTVKTAQLPGYTIDVQTMNQYNRKRFVQNKINYDPIKITFHDDNANQIRHLWHAYYAYYFNDTNQPGDVTPGDVAKTASILSKKNTYSADISKEQGYGYYGEYNDAARGIFNGKQNFFRTIRIYGFNQHNFAEYVLINPVIETFAHDQYDYYSNNGTMEHQMTVRYENVKYYEGSFNGQDPSKFIERFAEAGVYDTERSPINRPGNNKTIIGPGGLLDAGQGIVEDLSNDNILCELQKA